MLFAIPLIMSCSSLPKNQLPEKYETLKITWHKDGGMRYYSENITISTDSSFHKINDGGKITLVVFKTPIKKLESFYKELRNLDLSKIKSEKRKVYDRGGTSFNITVNKENHKYSNSGSSFLIKGQEEYYKIEEMIFQFINKNKE